MKLLLDTNVLVNLMMPMIPESHAAARGIMKSAHTKRVPLLVSASSVLDASWIIENGRAAKMLVAGRDVRRELASRLRGIVLTTVEVVPVDDVVIRKAHADPRGDDLDDAVVATTAEFGGASHIVTDDRRAFRQATTPTLTPIEALRLLEVLP